MSSSALCALSAIGTDILPGDLVNTQPDRLTGEFTFAVNGMPLRFNQAAKRFLGPHTLALCLTSKADLIYVMTEDGKFGWYAGYDFEKTSEIVREDVVELDQDDGPSILPRRRVGVQG